MYLTNGGSSYRNGHFDGEFDRSSLSSKCNIRRFAGRFLGRLLSSNRSGDTILLINYSGARDWKFLVYRVSSLNDDPFVWIVRRRQHFSIIFLLFFYYFSIIFLSFFYHLSIIFLSFLSLHEIGHRSTCLLFLQMFHLPCCFRESNAAMKIDREEDLRELTK